MSNVVRRIATVNSTDHVCGVETPCFAVCSEICHRTFTLVSIASSAKLLNLTFKVVSGLSDCCSNKIHIFVCMSVFLITAPVVVVILLRSTSNC